MKQMRNDARNARKGNAAAVPEKQKVKNAAVPVTGKENREHKDSLFVDLFYEDETAKKNLLSLYNALHNTDYRSQEMIRKIRVGNVLYKNFKNDISFAMDGKVIVFGEHQSTVNPNMPLRSLMYVGRAYEQLLDTKARYYTTLLKIPTPEFYTFYNGKQEFPLEKELLLSEAFLNTTGKNALELKVKAININSDKGHDILDKCEVLKEYSLFVDTVRKYAAEKNPIEKAVNECIKRGILTDYLKRKGSEVTNMLIAEYNYEEDIQVKQEEAMRIGKQKGKREGILLSGKISQAVKAHPDYTDEQIAEAAVCTVKDVKDVRKMLFL